MEQKRGRGRIKSVEGESINTSVVYSLQNFRWLKRMAAKEKTVPSVIVNRALERERRDGTA